MTITLLENLRMDTFQKDMGLDAGKLMMIGAAAIGFGFVLHKQKEEIKKLIVKNTKVIKASAAPPVPVKHYNQHAPLAHLSLSSWSDAIEAPPYDPPCHLYQTLNSCNAQVKGTHGTHAEHRCQWYQETGNGIEKNNLGGGGKYGTGATYLDSPEQGCFSNNQQPIGWMPVQE